MSGWVGEWEQEENGEEKQGKGKEKERKRWRDSPPVVYAGEGVFVCKLVDRPNVRRVAA